MSQPMHFVFKSGKLLSLLAAAVCLIPLPVLNASGQPSTSAAALAVPSFSVPFVSDIHGLWSYGLNFGVDPSATKGQDAALGEVEYPPFPPAGGYTNWITPFGDAFLDIRPYVNPAQIDTYAVGIATEGAYPITFSWPDLSPYYSGPVRLKYGLEGPLFDIDMKAQTSYTMVTGPAGDFTVVILYVVAQGPLPVGPSYVSTFGVASGGFQGVVSAPPGGSSAGRGTLSAQTGTTAWFEYGQTKSYGNTTTPQTIPDGLSVNISSPFDAGSLPIDSRLHFRAVTQNSIGRFYGGDRIISRGNPPPEVVEDTTKYRTATYLDWADARDFNGKRQSVKPKATVYPFDIRPPICQSAESHDLGRLHVEFSAPIDTFGQWLTVLTDNHPGHIIENGGSAAPADKKLKKWDIVFDSVMSFGDGVSLQGFAWTTKPKLTATYSWIRTDTVVCGKQKYTQTGGSVGYPMPNLHNAGEQIYGGVRQTPVDIVVGWNPGRKGPHTVHHPKYKDVMKSLVKDRANMYHTAAPHPLDRFDKNHREILTAQKSLPPDKHNNRLFAEQLTLKLNVAASDSGIFPPGLGDLLYDNSGVKGLPGPFDGLSIRAILDSVDKYLGDNGPVAGTSDSTEFLKVDSMINAAFEGPIDTVSWSGGKMICTGVRTISGVPYLHAGPVTLPGTRVGLVSAPWVDEPSTFRLEQNYPNPFNPVTNLQFSIAGDRVVTLTVYDVLGRQVATLLDHELMDEGNQEVAFDGSKLASGVYYYRLTVQDAETQEVVASAVRKMMLLK